MQRAAQHVGGKLTELEGRIDPNDPKFQLLFTHDNQKQQQEGKESGKLTKAALKERNAEYVMLRK